MSEQIQIPTLSYYQQRMDALGVTEEINRIDLFYFDGVGKPEVRKPTKIFRQTDKGIDILVYTVDALPLNYAKEGSRWKKNEFCITRLEKPIITKKGDTIKYLLPKDQPTQPFFPPALVDAYLKGEKIKTLVLTEGYFKAFKAAMHGMYCVGLSSITHMKDKNSGNLHEDIKKLILKCQVENVIWLMDGDCISITGKEITDGVDLYKKPKAFFSTCNTFKDLFSEFESVKKYAAHQRSNDIEGQPKGIDDLLCQFPGQEDEYVSDLVSLHKKPVNFYREDITFNISPLHHHFLLHNVDSFIIHHASIRPEIKNVSFKYNGTQYKWDEEKQQCKVVVPGEASNYFRVGDQFHAFVNIPNKYNELERTFHRRQKGTIIDDHGKGIVQHIPKYQAFCNVPDHVNYQAVIHNCFNMYAPFEHEPEEGECTLILSFLKHIFGAGEVKWKDPNTGESRMIKELELGLDYITLLYKRPTQILPILCLVSREQGTGKTTLGKLLKLIFTQNVAMVGNAELADNFNASWASKLLIICDETKIDKQVVVEKVKALSTADKIFMNAKGKDHVEIDFFGKFIFFTNNEENFIYASSDDVRYWIRKIPVLTTEQLDVNMLEKMQAEIPAFLHLLNTRQIVTPNRHRAWFDPELIKTEALKKVIEHSKSGIEKEIRSKLINMFKDFGCETIMMSLSNIRDEFKFRHGIEDSYIERVLRENIKSETYHYFEYQGQKYATMQDIITANGGKPLDEDQRKTVIKKKPTKRYSYPRIERVMVDGNKPELKRVEVNCIGRPFIFKREDFLTADEIAQIDLDPEMMEANEMSSSQQELFPSGKKDDMPF